MMISGVVIKGVGKGKNLGFPTVNIQLLENIESGVYSGKVFFDGKKYKAGIFVKENILEAHIIGFNGDLYGEEIEVEIGERIRDVKKFENKEELKKQIKRDLKLLNINH